MKVAIIGSRNCGALRCEDVIARIPRNCTAIVSGGARGVDTLAREAARILGLSFTCFLPDYKTYGQIAPLQRNITIVDSCDFLLAFWDMHSAGTRYVISYCLKCDKPFKIIKIDS